ncbi:MAG: acyl-CoA dehydrogenase family protein [Firmicutes bacterium]|nr:acyl-CoA dehydrogenase family protein [Bacillota bacterium]
MAYLIKETGAELLHDVRRFCELEVYKQSVRWDREGRASAAVLEKVRQLGYYTLTIPEELGGLGLGSVDVAAVLEEIAKADAGLAVSIAGSNLALRTVLAGGTQEQKEQICSRIAEGEVGAFCLTETDAGSDVMNMKMRASHMADQTWMLTGTKQFITNGSTADFYVVAAVSDETGTPSLFLVDAGTEGLNPGAPEKKLGIRSCDTCSVDLNYCKIPEANLIGGPEAEHNPNHGMKAILAALNEGRALMAAMAVGVAQRAMEEAIRYGKERKQFDRAITDNQAIRFKLADIQIKIEAARQLTAHALQVLDNQWKAEAEKQGGGRISASITYMPQLENAAAAAAMAKAFAADTAIEVTGGAMEIFGGYGYMTHFPAEKLLRDARVFQIIEGTGEMQRQLISGVLLGNVQAAQGERG